MEMVVLPELGVVLVLLGQETLVLTVIPVMLEITARLEMVVPQETQGTLGLLAMLGLVAMVAHEVTAGHLVVVVMAVLGQETLLEI